jgi:hypothetical protein
LNKHDSWQIDTFNGTIGQKINLNKYFSPHNTLKSVLKKTKGCVKGLLEKKPESERQDPDPHQRDKQGPDPDPHQSYKQDPDPHHFD